MKNKKLALFLAAFVFVVSAGAISAPALVFANEHEHDGDHKDGHDDEHKDGEHKDEHKGH